MGLYFFADNNYFCWTGLVFGWEECLPYFHGLFFVFPRESFKATDTLVSGHWCPGFSNAGRNKEKNRQLDRMVLYTTKLIDFEECLKPNLVAQPYFYYQYLIFSNIVFTSLICLFIKNEFSITFWQ